MHDKLKLLLDKISLPEEYYEFFNNGKILKLKLDHTRRNGIFVIEIDNPLDTKVLEYIDKNMKKGFPEMVSIKSEFVLRNVNFDDCLNYYKEAILKSTLTKPMKELFIEKKVKMSGDTLIIDTDNIAEENILNNHLESILKYYKVCGYPNLKIKTFINEENRLKVKKELEEECTKLDVISDEIDSILKECIDLKDKKVCQKCYSQIEKNMKFCPECGAKQEETEKNEDVKQVEVVEETNSDEKEPEITTENIDGKIEINETPGNANLTEEEKEQAQENLEKTVAIEADVETENDSDIEE